MAVVATVYRNQTEMYSMMCLAYRDRERLPTCNTPPLLKSILRRAALFCVLLMCGFAPRGSAQLVISEIMYHPVEEPAFKADGSPVLDLYEDVHEFIEIHNPTANPVDLTDWKISGGVSYAFPTGAVMQAGQFRVIARDPADRSTGGRTKRCSVGIGTHEHSECQQGSTASGRILELGGGQLRSHSHQYFQGPDVKANGCRSRSKRPAQSRTTECAFLQPTFRWLPIIDAM